MNSPDKTKLPFDKSHTMVRNNKGDFSASGNEEETGNQLILGRKKQSKLSARDYNRKRMSIKEYAKNPRLLSSTLQVPGGNTLNSQNLSSRHNRSRK